jgi:hypothetical protein
MINGVFLYLYTILTINQFKMKNLLFISLLLTGLTSCQTPTQKETNHSNETTVIGYEFNDKGEKLNIIAGDVGITKIYLDHIQALNDRDLDKIIEMYAEDITVYRINGSIGKGHDDSKQFLGDWFKSSNPHWKAVWMVTNTVEHKEGENEHWLTTGNEVTDTIDGKETMKHVVIDFNIVDGKIKKINVYARAKEQE